MSDIAEVKAFIDNVCRMALFVPPDDAVLLVSEFEKMGALMPIVNPTGYLHVVDNMSDHRKAAEAFLEFRRALEHLKVKEVSNE